MSIPVNQDLFLTCGADADILGLTTMQENSFPELSSFDQSADQLWRFEAGDEEEVFYLRNHQGLYFAKDPASDNSYLSDEAYALEVIFDENTQELYLANATENVIAYCEPGTTPQYQSKGSSAPSPWAVRHPNTSV